MTLIVGHWQDVRDAMPKSFYTQNEDGSEDVNAVLVRYKKAPECGSEYQVCNTVYFRANRDDFTHWAYIEVPFL